VSSTTTIHGVMLDVGSEEDFQIVAGGVVTSTTIGPYGGINVESGGVAIDTVVSGIAAGESVDWGGVARGVTVQGYSDLLVSGYLSNYASATNVTISSGGRMYVESGGFVTNVREEAGAYISDDSGAITYSGAGTHTMLASLTGSGQLVEDGPGSAVISGDATGFTGTAVINGGTLELADAGGFGSGASIAFEAPSGTPASLRLLRVSQPANGGTFAATLVNLQRLDLSQQSYIAGATVSQTASGLTLTDGNYAATFKVAESAASYQVTNDGHGGTLITPVAGQAQGLTSAMAVFGGAPAAAIEHAATAEGTRRPDVFAAGGLRPSTLARM
jgi:hypothetical protein